MSPFRRAGLGACVLLAAVMTACSSPAPDSGAGSQPGSSQTAGASAPSTTAPAGAPTGTASRRPSAAPTTKDQPVPKVERSGGGTSAPTVKAKPTSIDGTVKYSDGVRLGITDVRFGKETDKGPGAFPGRAYAILSLEVENSSDKALSMQTVVVTVLDSKNEAVAPVYVNKAKVQDFSGTLKPGSSAKARYAFAVPKKSRDKVTVVVDFDGVHTSAVFRGNLS